MNLLARVLLGIAALTVFVLLFFFVAAALVLGAVVVTVLVIRFWWLKRRLEREQRDSEITTEYTVIERERMHEPRLPAESPVGTEQPPEQEQQGKQPER